MRKIKLSRIAGDFQASRLRFAVVLARFNSFVGERLLAAALEALEQSGVDLKRRVKIVSVPGAFEIPQAAAKLARSNRYDAIITLGCVIKGETPHFEYVCAGCARGIEDVSAQTKIPITFGVLTCNDLEEAIQRAGGKAGNKGRDAALAAVEMATLMKRI